MQTPDGSLRDGNMLHQNQHAIPPNSRTISYYSVKENEFKGKPDLAKKCGIKILKFVKSNFIRFAPNNHRFSSIFGKFEIFLHKKFYSKSFAHNSRNPEILDSRIWSNVDCDVVVRMGLYGVHILTQKNFPKNQISKNFVLKKSKKKLC